MSKERSIKCGQGLMISAYLVEVQDTLMRVKACVIVVIPLRTKTKWLSIDANGIRRTLLPISRDKSGRKITFQETDQKQSRETDIVASFAVSLICLNSLSIIRTIVEEGVIPITTISPIWRRYAGNAIKECTEFSADGLETMIVALFVAQLTNGITQRAFALVAIGNLDDIVRPVWKHTEGVRKRDIRNIVEIEKSIQGSRSGLDSGVSARVLGQFLQWRQETKAPVFLCCTCNDITAIPTEFYRPGRIDGIFATGLPDHDERVDIIQIHMRKRKKKKDLENIDLNVVSEALDQYTGAEIEQCVVEAVFMAFSSGKIPITQEMLVEAAGTIVPQSSRNKEEMDALKEWAKERAKPVSTSGIRKRSSDNVRKLGVRRRAPK